jgi:hypothetical protein
LRYLQSLEVKPECVEFVVVTHWDKDHISGVVRLAREASKARIVVSAALRSPDFVILAIRHQQKTYGSPLGSGTKEFVRLLDLITQEDRSPKITVQDVTLAEETGVRLVALSPSSSVALDALSASFVRVLEAAETGDSVTEPTPNAASVVLAVRGPMGDLLLGADLEREGWPAAMSSVLAQGLIARMFKVPHHGSEDADAPEVWANHLRSDAVYAMTRFNNAERSLPSNDDRARMRARTPSGHVVGQPPSRRHLHGVVGRRVRAGTRNGVWLDTGPVGHYRWRGRLASEAPDVSLAGPVELV